MFLLPQPHLPLLCPALNNGSINPLMISPKSPFYCSHCIHCRLPEVRCVCDEIERVELPFNIVLCCHSKEWQRNDNTGQWALLSSKNIQRIRWHRKPELITPCLPVADLGKKDGHYLLFPGDDARAIQQLTRSKTDQSIHLSPIKTLWLIDGTWQEAQKILRQSPWLKAMPTLTIQAKQGHSLKSHFKLRKNQQGLCTLEAIEAAIADQAPLAAQTLRKNFNLFQDTFLDLLR